MEYEMIVGLEVHAELLTDTKLYCSCANAYGAAPNSLTCPICLGLPGAMPAINEKAIEYCIKAGMALNSNINMSTIQHRKHYYYPDLPKGFQISQHDTPICTDGYLDIDLQGNTKRIGISRIHLEEDAGKLIHQDNETKIDYNRCGVPLIEIVSAPDFNSSVEVKAYLEGLRLILLYAGVCSCKMEQGALRCDINLSVRPKGQRALGTRTEMKNLNSISAAYRAVEYEFKRQADILISGGTITQDTLRWDDVKGQAYKMRTKENAQEYFFMPEPDIMPIILNDSKIKEIKNTIPILPQKRLKQYKELGISQYEAEIILCSVQLSDLLDECILKGANAKQSCNWILGDLSRVANLKKESINISADMLIELMEIINCGQISNTIAVKILEELLETGDSPKQIAKKRGFTQLNDSNEIAIICKKAIESSPKAFEDYKKGKTKAMASIIGQAMKICGGRANPQLLGSTMDEVLNNMIKGIK